MTTALVLAVLFCYASLMAWVAFRVARVATRSYLIRGMVASSVFLIIWELRIHRHDISAINDAVDELHRSFIAGPATPDSP